MKRRGRHDVQSRQHLNFNHKEKRRKCVARTCLSRGQPLTLSCFRKNSILSSRTTRLAAVTLSKTFVIRLSATRCPSRGFVTSLHEIEGNVRTEISVFSQVHLPDDSERAKSNGFLCFRDGRGKGGFIGGQNATRPTSRHRPLAYSRRRESCHRLLAPKVIIQPSPSNKRQRTTSR